MAVAKAAVPAVDEDLAAEHVREWARAWGVDSAPAPVRKSAAGPVWAGDSVQAEVRDRDSDKASRALADYRNRCDRRYYKESEQEHRHVLDDNS